MVDFGALVEALPEAGEVSFEQWKRDMQAAGKSHLVEQFHKARRSGAIAARLVREGEGENQSITLVVARPGGA